MDTMGFHFAVQNCIVPDWLLFRPDQLNFWPDDSGPRVVKELAWKNRVHHLAAAIVDPQNWIKRFRFVICLTKNEEEWANMSNLFASAWTLYRNLGMQKNYIEILDVQDPFLWCIMSSGPWWWACSHGGAPGNMGWSMVADDQRCCFFCCLGLKCFPIPQCFVFFSVHGSLLFSIPVVWAGSFLSQRKWPTPRGYIIIPCHDMPLYWKKTPKTLPLFIALTPQKSLKHPIYSSNPGKNAIVLKCFEPSCL